ncbi:MAG: tRNA lysidine(34) synthetase TilS [bacterium]
MSSPFTINSSFPVLIACSGGIDSMALLYMMEETCRKEKIRLGACYVDHKLRQSAKSESQFVRKICQKLGVEFYHLEFVDNFWDEGKANFEEKARKERYRLLFECAKKHNFGQIATAHHLDDQVETLLMRIFERGTGIKGLRGIGKEATFPYPNNDLTTIKIIRPLLHLTKKEIEKFMMGKEFVVDETNSDTSIRRNFYRAAVVPAIENALKNDKFKDHIAKLSDNAERETEFAETMAKEFWENFKTGENSFEIPRETIENRSDNFWITAFSYLFSYHRNFSHSTDTLIDVVKFIRKKEKSSANYHPFVFERKQNFVKVSGE